MVYFSCGGCNESLKKPKVAKHLTFCRRCSILTCLDCQKDFTPESYVRHTQCISEVEKYSGPGYVQAENANKGQKKQMGWMDSVRSAAEAYMEETKNNKNKKNEQILLNGLLRYENIPRKKAKFINFVKSSFGQFRYNEPLIDTIWDIISKPQELAKDESQQTSESPNNTSIHTNDLNEEKNKQSDQKTKSKKRSREEALGSDDLTASTEADIENIDDEVDIKKKNKHKKRKKEKADEDIDTVTNNGVGDNGSIETPLKKKKKKKKKGTVEHVLEGENGNASEKKSKKRLGESVSDEDCEKSPSPKRSKKDYAPESFIRERLNATLEEKTPCKFRMIDVVRDVLENKGESGITLKKLEKKVTSAYHLSLREGQVDKTQKILAKLKIILSKHFRVTHDRAFLKHVE